MEVDLAIVGNGAVGCAIGLAASERHPDLRVAIVGPAARAGGASLAAGAMLNVFAEVVAGALDFPLARKKLAYAALASRLWEDHLDTLNRRLERVAPVQIRPGTYVVSSAAEGTLEHANFDAIASALKAYGEPLEVVDPARVAGTSPRTPYTRAMLLPNEGAMPARHLHDAYDEAFRRSANVTVVDATAEELTIDRAWKRLRTSAGAVAAKHIVLAAGTRTQAFVDALGLGAAIPRIVLGTGASLVVDAPSGLGDHAVRTPSRGPFACGVYAVPYGDGSCYVGATSAIRVAEERVVGAERELLARAAEHVHRDFAAATIRRTMVGHRPTTLDTHPLLGATSIEGVWIASGTRRDGLHLSPAIGRELVTAIDRGTQPFDGVFVPERALILEVPRERAIAAALAFTGCTEDEVMDAYARAGLARHAFGIPPELLETYREGHAAKNVARLLGRG